MPWDLSKDFTFEAAHHLPYHDGKCRRVHGHSFGLRVVCRGTFLYASGPQTGMVIDYGTISRAVQPLLEATLDHHDLNVTTGLESPTSEALAQYIFTWLSPRLPGLVAIEIAETCTSRCRYAPA